MLTLTTLVNGNRESRPLEDGAYLIGRGEACRIRFDFPEVSERHAVLTVRGGRAMIEDLHSANGTFVNGDEIDRAVVRERIAARLDGMFLAGLEEEKRRLHALYPVWSRTAALAIGYREGDDREKILTRTCQLAKRQDTWFRHQATPLYVEPTVDSVRACWRTHGPWTEVPRILAAQIRP